MPPQDPIATLRKEVDERLRALQRDYKNDVDQLNKIIGQLDSKLECCKVALIGFSRELEKRWSHAQRKSDGVTSVLAGQEKEEKLQDILKRCFPNEPDIGRL